MRYLTFCLMVVLTACAHIGAETDEAENTLPPPSLEKIADGVWVHKSYENIDPWGPVLSQGLVIERSGGALLIDTAWNNADTEKLLALIQEETGLTPAAAVITHGHADKMGGVAALHQAGVTTMAHHLTNEDAPAHGFEKVKKALFLARNREMLKGVQSISQGTSLTIDFGDAFYPGPGHTRDNIVVYDPASKVLFGGCLIRPGGAKGLGNTADADVANWADAVRKVAAEFPHAEIIIPSHGGPGGRELLQHTIALAKVANGQ